MSTDVSIKGTSQHSKHKSSKSYMHNDKSAAYQGFQSQRRMVTSSPETYLENRVNSPMISPAGSYRSVIRDSSNDSVSNIKKSSYKSFLSPSSIEETDSKHISRIESPFVTEVSMPGGIRYTINEEQSDMQNSTRSRRNSEQIMISDKESVRSVSKRSPRYNPISETESEVSTRRKTSSVKSRKSNFDDESSSVSESETESDISFSSSVSRQKSRKREKDKQKDKILNMLMEDYLERKKREKEEKVASQSQRVRQTPLRMTPGYQIPTGNPEPEVKKSKIPDYDQYSELDKDKIREKFRNNYNLLMINYPKWKIELPDFNTLPLRLIHERYEDVIKMICIFQTAMKWKVYLIIIIAAIEYYGYNVKKYAFLKGLLKSQIKNIHKYNNYLVEFASMFYSDDVGDEYPIWMRFLGTFASSLGCFSSINGLAKLIGNNFESPEFILDQADRFVSPADATAKFHCDGISDVPDVPSGFQDPDTAVSMINTGFEMLRNGFGGDTQASFTDANPQTANPVDQKPKVVDDYDNADF